MNRIRWWLIRRLIGKNAVILNTTFVAPVAVDNANVVVENCTFTGGPFELQR